MISPARGDVFCSGNNPAKLWDMALSPTRTPKPQEASIARTTLAPWAVPLGAGALALLIASAVPLVSPLLLAMVVGAVVANSRLSTWGWFRDNATQAKFLLRLGVVFLGFRLPLGELAAIGVEGLAVIVLTMLATYRITCWLGDRLQLDRGLTTLIATGFAVCGASAIAAVQDTTKARKEDVALAVALVTLFGSAMIVLLPAAAALLGMSDVQLGVWAGASIHEVAQVVAAASIGGGIAAVAVATTVKLGRVALLAPVYMAAKRRHASDAAGHTKSPLVPWFLVGFVVCAAVRTVELLPKEGFKAADIATTVLLAAGMFGLGQGVHFATLLPIPGKALVLATASTAVAVGVSLPLALAAF